MNKRRNERGGKGKQGDSGHRKVRAVKNKRKRQKLMPCRNAYACVRKMSDTQNHGVRKLSRDDMIMLQRRYGTSDETCGKEVRIKRLHERQKERTKNSKQNMDREA